ncbi:type II toxin-antitoxin system RelE/ParE family toxin [Mucilaginibacter pedocola]|uniref:Addiction module toxin RelE n=1 Tax=Mucilaginibacter pedocola TaxID=1792845 RepID=A0A1S9P7Q4_9SPHI|nr:type II toxin-antitoxin system RelE/ParE family toxin [Mucilaginibacter pedocola]OOQ56990.1 hypothetical protein BC343_15730 [Mucilaginibacter pedocola]
MPHRIIYSSRFIRKAKDLKKKHLSLVEDLKVLESSLLVDPTLGVDLGAGLRKIRLAVTSKSKGKSGGYRVITFLVTENEGAIAINMLTLYDKSEESSINKKRLLEYVKELE